MKSDDPLVYCAFLFPRKTSDACNNNNMPLVLPETGRFTSHCISLDQDGIYDRVLVSDIPLFMTLEGQVC